MNLWLTQTKDRIYCRLAYLSDRYSLRKHGHYGGKTPYDGLLTRLWYRGWEI